MPKLVPTIDLSSQYLTSDLSVLHKSNMHTIFIPLLITELDIVKNFVQHYDCCWKLIKLNKFKSIEASYSPLQWQF